MRFALAVFLILFTSATLGWAYLGPEITLHNALQPKPPITIIMLGDSHTFIADWRELEGCDQIANFGIGGNTTAQMLERLPAVIQRRPRYVFIMGGTNDMLQNVDPQKTIANLTAIEGDLKVHNIGFSVLPPPPLVGHESEVLEIAYVSTLAIPFTVDDLLADGTHLRRSGYAKWRDAISPIVARYC